MTTKVAEVPTFIIWGTAPESDFQDVDGEAVFAPGQPVTKPLEVELGKQDADYYVMRGVLTAFQTYLGQVKPGGSVSVFISRGPEASEEEPEPPGTTASFVINNPDARHVWDFHVEKRKAVL